MASFPNAVKSFTTKNIGDVVQPADINDLQDEVNAIEAGYINGTAPLNAANSTLANLSVSGGSTFAGNVTLNGALSASNSTVTNLTISGTLTLSALPHCILRNAATQSIGDGAWTGMSFDTEDEDVGAMHSTASNSSRVTITSTGIYRLTATVYFNANSSGLRGLRFAKNDVTLLPTAAFAQGISVNGVGNGMCISALHRFSTSGDWVTAQAFQNSGGNLNISDSTAAHLMTSFAVEKAVY